METTKGSGNILERVNRSIELDTNLAKRASMTFSMPNPNRILIDQEQGSVSPSQASRMTDSVRVSDTDQKERLKNSKIRAKRKPAISDNNINISNNKVEPGRRLRH